MNGCLNGRPDRSLTGNFRFLCQLILILAVLQGDLGQQFIFCQFPVRMELIQILTDNHKVSQQLVSLCVLFIQNLLGFLQLGTGFLQLRFFGFQILLGLHYFLRHTVHFIQTALVGSRNLIDHGHTVQKIGEAVGLENHGPIGQLALFLHGSDPLPVLLGQLIQTGLCFLQLCLLIGNEEAVRGNLIVDVGNLIVQQRNLLVDQILLGHNALNILAVFGLLGFQITDLGSNTVLLRLKGIQLLLQFAGGQGTCRTGQNTDHKSKDHSTYQNQRQDRCN